MTVSSPHPTPPCPTLRGTAVLRGLALREREVAHGQASGLMSAPEWAPGASSHPPFAPHRFLWVWSSLAAFQAGLWGPGGSRPGISWEAGERPLRAPGSPQGPGLRVCRAEREPGDLPSSRRRLCACHSRPGSRWGHVWGRRSKRRPPAVRSGGRPDSPVAESLRQGRPSGRRACRHVHSLCP